MRKLPTLSQIVNRMIVIPPEPIELTKSDGTTITIPPPDVHIGLQPLSVRLLSKEKRQGMVRDHLIYYLK